MTFPTQGPGTCGVVQREVWADTERAVRGQRRKPRLSELPFPGRSMHAKRCRSQFGEPLACIVGFSTVPGTGQRAVFQPQRRTEADWMNCGLASHLSLFFTPRFRFHSAFGTGPRSRRKSLLRF
jgi:hypothetical protein